MLFSSISFLYFFLPVVLGLYFAVPKRFKNIVLLVSSLVFYFYGEQSNVWLLLFSSAVGYAVGLVVNKFRGSGKAKLALVFSITLNLLILGFFKYSNFLIDIVNALVGTSLAPIRVSLPLGISFFIFQTISYNVDVYRDSVPTSKNFLDFTMYVSMFPQLVAGPIVRYHTVAQELHERKHTVNNFSVGIGRLITGLAKKVIIANALGELSPTMLAVGQTTVLSSWLSILAYVLQIYFDFSGYSDMAIGLGRMFGFHFPENFNYPFIAQSISEFWRRWHISMGTWFREYIYIPLGGNRVSKLKWIRNIFIVWFCTGLWHGANWNFILWGLYFGVLLAVEKLVLGKILDRFPRWLRHVYTMVLVFMSFILFHIENLPDMLTHIGQMFGAGGIALADVPSLYYLKSYALLLIIACIGSTDLPKNMMESLKNKEKWGAVMAIVQPVAYALMLLVVTGYLIDATFNPFLYFRF